MGKKRRDRDKRQAEEKFGESDGEEGSLMSGYVLFLFKHMTKKKKKTSTNQIYWCWSGRGRRRNNRFR